MSQSSVAVGPPLWEVRRCSHLTFFFEPDSYADRTIDQIATRAEAAYQRGREWFGDESPPDITFYLTSWLDDVARPGWSSVPGGLLAADRPIAWLLTSPEHPAVGLEHAILQLQARSAPPIGRPPPAAAGGPPPSSALPALAGLIAAEHGVGPGPNEADRIVYERHVLGKAPAQLFVEGTSESTIASNPAELSFLAFLTRTYGATALARFARGLVAESPAAAASSAFGQPLPTLQASWLASLRSRHRPVTTSQDMLRRALPLLRPHWRRQAELLVYMLLDLIFTLAIPLSTKYLFDDIIAQQDFGRLAFWLVAVLGIFACGSLTAYRRTVVGGLIGQLVLRDIRRAGFAQLQYLSQRFYVRSSTGDLLSRITNDMDSIQVALGQTLPILLFQMVSLIAGATVLLLLNWKLGLLVLLLGAPVFAGVYSRASERLRRASRELHDRIGAMTAFAQENISAQQVIKSYSLERREIGSFEQHLTQLLQGSIRLIGVAALLQGSSNMIFLAIRVLVLAAGALLIMREQMSVGELVAFAGMIVQVLSPVVQIAGLYQQLQTSTGSFDRVQELMDEVPDAAEDPRAVDLPGLQREIRLEHVTFRYDEGEAGLRDVSLTIPAGQRVALVGPSGAGKSTLIGLLLRLYDPNEGRILFDGRDIREATLASLRRQQALVPQDTFLFNASIKENIALGRDGASDEEVAQAARAAAVHEVVEQTGQGYQTVVGERGVRLSGGQRQRLAIARALLRDPRVLILDEATSALDPETEMAIRQTLEQAGQGRTTVAITHRLGSVADYDTIFVLDRGRLVEQGTHEELCQQRGLYWRLYRERQDGVLQVEPSIEPRRLARVPLFASFSLAELAAVAQRVSVEQYPAEAVVVRQGESADKLYVIAEGEVEVLVDGHQSTGRRVKLLGARSYFGEIALLGGGSSRRNATVRTLTPAELYSLHKEDFLGLLQGHPSLAEAVSRLARMRAEQTRHLAAAGQTS